MLEIFMTEYDVEFYHEDVISEDLSIRPCLTYFAEKVDNPKEAAVEAIQELGRKIKEYNIRSGKVKNPEGEDYEILKDGAWTIDPETGEKLDSLEGKLKQEQ